MNDGFCNCGCGQKTLLMPINNKFRGWVKDMPFKFLHGHNRRKPFNRETFFSMFIPVSECGCWIWEGTTEHAGYGVFRFNNKAIRAHRLSWELTYGHIPKGMHVLHTCDTPACGNPRHLFIGTALDNCRDACKKKRNAFGERHGHAKLTNQQVFEIRKDAHSTREIAKKYNVSYSLITGIKNNKRWRHVK
jgi:hypothetical protein